MMDEKETRIKSETYRFGDCELDAQQRELRRAGNRVTTQPKAFELLLYLIRNRARAVDKDELQDAIWPRSIVTETALTRCVMKARRSVGDDADRQSVIRTVHGHGYRFVADIDVAATSDAPAAPPPEIKRHSRGGSRSIGAVALLVASIATLWWYLTPQALGGDVRLAVLPIENATGDPEMDWVGTGLMALMNRMLEDGGVTVVSGNSVTGLAAEKTLDELMSEYGEFRQVLSRTTAATHFVGASLDDDGGLYRLTYTIAGESMRPERRTIVGKEPTKLVREVVATISMLVMDGTPENDRIRTVSDDDFLNEAYARAMSLYFEGRYEEARRLFQVIIEQEPDLFWPRYEYALASRNVREYDLAERLLIELRGETVEKGELAQQAAVQNALGVLYLGRRRYDDARVVLNDVLRLAPDSGGSRYAAAAHENLGLIAKGTGDIQLAYEHMQQSIAAYEMADIQSLPGTLHNNLSGVLIQLGDLEEAEKHSLAAIENFRLTGKRLYEGYAQSRLSSVYRRLGMLDEAEDAAEQSLSVREEMGDQKGIASSMISISAIAAERGDLTRSKQFAEQARDIGNEIEDTDISVAALIRIGKAELTLGKPREAAAQYAAAEAISRSIGDRTNEFASRYGVARSRSAMGDFDGALAIGNQLLTETRDDGNRRLETGALTIIAEVHMGREQWSDAISVLNNVRDIAIDIGDNGIEAGANASLAESWLALSDVESARPFVEQLVNERPADTDVLKLQANLAAHEGQADEAVRIMAMARTQAGEGWHDEDAELLESYRQAATTSEIDGQ